MSDKTEKKRKTYGLSLDQELMREVKHLAVDEDQNVNEMVEEGLRLLIQKYKKRGKG